MKATKKVNRHRLKLTGPNKTNKNDAFLNPNLGNQFGNSNKNLLSNLEDIKESKEDVYEQLPNPISFLKDISPNHKMMGSFQNNKRSSPFKTSKNTQAAKTVLGIRPF